ncbi:calcium-binding protein [Neogemmobacter tilapiae]|uniref:Hemolysin expression modulating protein n=1 Tax=Neogemmobacter tilapiae TaxID=875041 RepID=A0A918TF22_9RHOB|nr:calcium-binding protein [Gemmobacter tilapiae]GHC43481.1 hemolysin expression modulating protein [Gemmobacter tilapiae]
MAKVYGTNTPDNLLAAPGGDALFGWDKSNAPGREGPSTDHDTLTGGAGDDTLSGGQGNDVLFGGEGRNLLLGGNGDDRVTMLLGFGRDTADGGNGVDVLTIDASAQTKKITHVFGAADTETALGDGSTYIGFERLNFLGGKGDDYVIAGALSDRLYGGEGDDRLVAGGGRDQIWGDQGDDRIYGELGRDRLYGGDGADALGGGDGDDTLIGGLGKDTLFGQEGRDVFVFNEAGEKNFDMIEGFDGSEDRIHLSAALFDDLAKGALRSGQFVVGAEAKDANDRIIYTNGTGKIWLDVDGAGGAEKVLLAQIEKGLILNAGDFLII